MITYDVATALLVAFTILLFTLLVISQIDRQQRRREETKITIEAIKAGLQQKVVTRPENQDTLIGQCSYTNITVWVSPGPGSESPDLAMNTKVKSS